MSITDPVDHTVSVGEITLEHTTVPKIIEGKPDKITAYIHNPHKQDISLNIIMGGYKDNYPDFRIVDTLKLINDELDPARYYVMMPPRDRGTIIFYFIELKDSSTRVIGTIPEDNTQPVKLKYMGTVPPYIVIPHVIFMFGTILFASLALFDSLKIVIGRNAVSSMARNFLLATIAVFLGGYPFGWGMNYFAFGVMWEGFPFGIDFTDNKTQVVFLYLIMLVLSMPGSLYREKQWKNNFPDRVLGWLGIIGYLLVLTIYLIPHSIQFSIFATIIFSCGSTLLIFIICLIGLQKKYNLFRKGKWIVEKLANWL
jgi:hypothetical protein